MLWAERTWAELPLDLAAAARAAILPVGATEQHGPHMGCGMDAVLADRLCAAVAERTQVPMLPVLPYGCSLGHSRRWPGTIPLQPATLIGMVRGDRRRAPIIPARAGCSSSIPTSPMPRRCAARSKCCAPNSTT